MFTLFGSLTVTDFEAFKAATASYTKEQLAARGIVDQTLYRVIGEDRAVIANTYNTLEAAQKDGAMIAAVTEEQLAHIGAAFPMTQWLAEGVYHVTTA